MPFTIDEKAFVQKRWVRGSGRALIDGGEFRVRLGPSIRPLGGSPVSSHVGRTVVVIHLPFHRPAVGTNLLLAGADGPLFVSPKKSDFKTVIDALRNQGFEPEIHRVPRWAALPVGLFIAKPLLWEWARIRGWLKPFDEPEVAK